MRQTHPASRLAILCVFSLSAVVLGCNSPSPTPSQPSERNPAASSGTRHDLSQDEAAGGHTLRKHVGRTDDQLRERLDRERDISAASTWNDRAAAELAIGDALAQQSYKIQRWLQRDGGHPNLVLDYDGDSSHPFGRTLRRSEQQIEPCAHANIVLRWDGPNAYHVLTAYPECRR